MKVAFVTQALSNGGAERVVTLLANEMVLMKHDITIISILGEIKTNTYKVNSNVKVIKIKKSTNNAIELLARTYKLRQLFKREKYDVIISFTTQKNVSVILSTLLTSNKVIVSERNDPFNDPQSKILRILRKCLYRFADGFVFQTEGARNFFSNNIVKKSVIINNPISNDLKTVNNSVKLNKIVTVSRLEKEKNIEMTIKAFYLVSKKNKELTLEIYGQGSQENYLKEIINSLGMENRIFLKGFSKNIYDDISKAKVFLFSSNYEGVSNALTEAVCMGIPVVSADHSPGGAREVICDGYNGYIVPLNDYEAMAKRMENILNNKELAEKISLNGMKTVEKFNQSTITNQWINYIQSIRNSKKDTYV